MYVIVEQETYNCKEIAVVDFFSICTRADRRAELRLTRTEHARYNLLQSEIYTNSLPSASHAAYPVAQEQVLTVSLTMFFSNGRRAIAIMARRMSVVTAASRVETRAIQTFPHQANGGTTSTSNAAARFQSSSSSPSSLGDYFGSLRVKAAQALTSTLPEEEKKQFLEKMAGETIMDPNDPEQLGSNDEDEAEEASIHRQHSINEAVAAARAREAERYEEKWEKEKEKLMAEAEEAALRRVESDLEIQRRQLAFEAWKRDLERDQQQQQQDAPSTASSAQSREEALGEHPILGPVIADLGSKRIHAASARALAAIPVWKKQRIYRHGRAKSMARDKIKSLHLGLPGVIGLYEVGASLDHSANLQFCKLKSLCSTFSVSYYFMDSDDYFRQC